MAEAKARGDVVAVWADENQVVEVHWRLKSGRIVLSRHDVPRDWATKPPGDFDRDAFNQRQDDIADEQHTGELAPKTERQSDR